MESFKLSRNEKSEEELDWSNLGGCLTWLVGWSLLGLGAFALFCVFPPIAIMYALVLGVFLVRR